MDYTHIVDMSTIETGEPELPQAIAAAIADVAHAQGLL
jgi:hypothetical protein